MVVSAHDALPLARTAKQPSRQPSRRMEMPPYVDVTPLDPTYPSRLRALPDPPASVTYRGGPLDAKRAVAIVGSRRAQPEAERFARQLAFALAKAGVVVVSGGAHGIDAAAHRGAVEASGRTWAVAGTGCEHCFPPDHADLFDAIGAGPGTMVWPFPRMVGVRPGAFLARNRVLVALSDAVVVVQAGVPSGALRAASCARRLGKPLWVVPAPPWALEFRGSHQLLDQGARALTSIKSFLDSLDLQRTASADPCVSMGELEGGRVAPPSSMAELEGGRVAPPSSMAELEGGRVAPPSSMAELEGGREAPPSSIDNRMDGQSERKSSVVQDASAPPSSCGMGSRPPRTIEEIGVYRVTSTAPLHLDEIALRASMPVATVAPTLLTLALENVVVEGPPGFFRRPKS